MRCRRARKKGIAEWLRCVCCDCDGLVEASRRKHSNGHQTGTLRVARRLTSSFGQTAAGTVRRDFDDTNPRGVAAAPFRQIQRAPSSRRGCIPDAATKTPGIVEVLEYRR